MPEILEIEFYRRLAMRALTRRIESVHAPDAWFLKGGLTAEVVVDALTGATLVSARRRGKLLLIDLDGERPVLGLRFGMTGRLLVDGDAAIERLEYSSDRDETAWDRFGLRFDDGGSMMLRDPRRLGGVQLDPEEERLGPDALDITEEELGAALGSSVAPLKARLLDQSRVAGLGNLLVDETLWRVGLDPAREAGSLESGELQELHETICDTLAELIERGGSHMGDLHEARHPDGHCPRDGAPLRRRTVGGRTTYSCPDHQR